MQVGENIVCVDSSFLTKGIIKEGNIYDVLEVNSHFVNVNDDNNVSEWFSRERFITVVEMEKILRDKTVSGSQLTPAEWVYEWTNPVLQKPTTLFVLPDGEVVPIPETLQPLNGDYIIFKGVKYQIVSLTHDVDQGVKIYKMEIVTCK